MNLLPRMFLRFEAVIYPNSSIPRLYRWFTRDKDKARDALQRIRRWRPQRILFCHGEYFAENAIEVINREFKFLD
jgi:glyoxylase-like metal-dependent hydrolase (beta-lactamase superfamily II)